MATLRENLLEGQRVAVSHDGVLGDRLRGLGAIVCGPGDDDGGAPLPAALVHDARPSFGEGGATALMEALDQTWTAVAEVANRALITGGRGGRIVLIAPPAEAGEMAAAARAGLENLARTLSIEWARYAITTTAIAPRSGARDDDLATLVAFLLSPAGGYYSGCRFVLGSR